MDISDQWMGYSGWRWLFVLESIPTLFLGIFVFLWLPNGPKEAYFLAEEVL